WREEISNVPDRHQFAEKHSGEGSRSESRTLYLRRWTAGDPLDGGAHRDRMVIRAKPDRATLVWRMFFESDAAGRVCCTAIPIRREAQRHLRYLLGHSIQPECTLVLDSRGRGTVRNRCRFA